MNGTDAAGFWPLWVGADFSSLGVWTLGYQADVSAWTSESMPLADRGTAILETLTNEGIGDRPVIFVTHSMGGILVKQILRHATSFGVERWESIAHQTRGIAFLATPHAGADLAGFAELARLVLRTNEQVGDLRAHHPRLRELHAWFLNFQGDQKVVCRTFCETRALRPAVLGLTLPGGVLVVDQTSAEPHVPGEVAIPLDEDHVSISKPRDRNAPLYKSLKRFIKDALAAPESRPEVEAGLPPSPRQRRTAEAPGAEAGQTRLDSAPLDLTGVWVAEVRKKGMAPSRLAMDFEMINGRLLGTVHYPTGDAGIHDGEVDGTRIRFTTTHTPQFDDKPAEIHFEGTITGETLEMVVQDANGHGRVTARRKT